MRALLSLVLIMSISAAISQTLLVAAGSNWKYYDQGNIGNQAWNTIAYDDSGWSQGNAELGYGDGDENTVVGYGPDANNKYMTTYFRKEISVTNPQQFAALQLEMLRDDGAVVYINGTEVWRSNMPFGPIGFSTPADGTVAWPNEGDWYTQLVSASYLQNGINVIAVEIHQENGSSSDISFNFKVIAQDQLNAQLERGPYLQMATQNSVILRWRTSSPTDSRVSFGISPANLGSTVISPQFTTEHSVTLTGLNPETMYYYSIGWNNQALLATPNLYFETLPPEGKPGVYEFLALGDCGSGYQEQLDVKNAVINSYGNHFNGVLLLGDNAYQSGFDSDYEANFFGRYDEIMENSVIWPAPGNHDYNNHIPFSPPPAYYDIFECPTSGQAGGVPSGTEKYYSFNHGNIHFISLDSYDEPRSASAAMAQWLQADLAANTMPWVIAYWHHPPYTKGSHDSDNDNFLDGELVDMREEILPILEESGVDLILNGHSHSYERSLLIDGHYGSSGDFSPAYMVQPGSGDYPQECPYRKSTDDPSHSGTVYCVAGNSGKTSSVQSDWPHPVMYSYTYQETGALRLRVENNRLDATFLTSTGAEFDHFAIVKDAGVDSALLVCVGDPVNVTPSWPIGANPTWYPGNIVAPSYSITALSDGVITGTDPEGCITDTYVITVLQSDSCGQLTLEELGQIQDFSVVYHDGSLTIFSDQLIPQEYVIYDLFGRQLQVIEAGDEQHTESLKFDASGLFYVHRKQTNSVHKFIRYD